jgi:hypothetical protein
LSQALKTLSKVIEMLFADGLHQVLEFAGALAEPEERFFADLEMLRM